jgi:hypothetical protein
LKEVSAALLLQKEYPKMALLQLTFGDRTEKIVTETNHKACARMSDLFQGLQLSQAHEFGRILQGFGLFDVGLILACARSSSDRMEISTRSRSDLRRSLSALFSDSVFICSASASFRAWINSASA